MVHHSSCGGRDTHVHWITHRCTACRAAEHRCRVIPDIQSAGSHIHEMMDLCISGSVVCIITSNTYILDVRYCIGVVQYIGAHAVPRYTQWHTNSTSNTYALMSAYRDVGYHMSRTMDQGSRGSGVSCPETVYRIATSSPHTVWRVEHMLALLLSMHLQWHYMCHARCSTWATSQYHHSPESWFRGGYPDDHISAMSCLATPCPRVHIPDSMCCYCMP